MKYKESETLEFKKSTSELKEAVISISAILNKHHYGEVYFGIKNNGDIIGQEVGSKTLNDVSRAISGNIEPKIYPKIQQIKLNNKTCIKASFNGKDVPYFAYGRVYIRVADEDRQISARELEHLVIKKNKDRLRWDNEVCLKAKLSHISAKKLKIFLKNTGLRYDTPFNSLAKLKLLSGRKLLNTAVVLFAKQPQDFFSNAKLRCAVFGKTDTSFIIDRKEFEGDIFYLIEKAQEYILKNIHIGMRVEGLRRIDVTEIDKEAFREAIINAFCHRDYREPGSVDVAIFKDRVEIRNPGLLYGDLTVEKITTEMVSERRNELIAELFHRMHIVEKWGRGIKLILSKEPETNFKEVGTHFIVVFKRKGMEENVPEKVTERVPEKVTENQKIILGSISKNKYITVPELAKIVCISERKIKENIKKLKGKNLLKRIGPDRGGYWERHAIA